ncbi:MAG: ribosome small subunit-dependent GTPase A [Ruminococcus sp.]|nr:ribosome small subunit-dependent GTPase A [Ruminococcus sp.]
MVGTIIKSIGGLYTVKSFDSIIECKARGVFRKDNISPVVGDTVEISNDVISKILPRKNFIVRPPLANLDTMVFVISTTKPSPNVTMLDKFIAVCEYKNINPVIALTKIDLADYNNILTIYNTIGIKTFTIDYSNKQSYMDLKEYLANKISAFTGNSGAGKSTLLNAIDTSLNIPTGDISQKLGRGRHTTRHSELYQLDNGGLIADTPGFSTFETNKYDIIKKENLASCFREFSPYVNDCRFNDCSHTKEKGCAVIQAVKDGIIPKSRHSSYCEMFENAKLLKDWEINN